MNLTVPLAEAAQTTQISGEKQSSGAPSILRNATPMSVSGGVARRSGSVGTGYEIYSFEAEAGDVVTIDIDVTRILQGTEYADDDSQLFLFDSQGRLIAENDDESEDVFQSKIVSFRIPRDGTYFVGVSTFDNNPNLNSSGVIAGWGNNGSSRFEYNLNVQGLSSLASGNSGSSTPTVADLVFPERCYMGTCYDQQFLGKNLIEQGRNGTLYSVELATRSWRAGANPPAVFEAPSTSYIYCSTTRPAYIFRSGNQYIAHLLNPGGDFFGYNAAEYPVYWATCHNFVGPNFFSDEMTNRAIQLGYPLDLPSEQIELSNVRNIMN